MKKIICILPIVLFSTLSIAKDVNTPVEYNYVSASLGNESIEGIDINSITTEVSHLLDNNIIIGSGYSYSQLDEGSLTVASNSFGVGVGYRLPISSVFDFVPGIYVGYALVDAKLYHNSDKYTANDSDMYYGGSIAINAGLTSKLDAKLSFALQEISDSSSQSINLSSSYYMTEKVALNIGVSKSFYENDLDGNNIYGGIKYKL